MFCDYHVHTDFSDDSIYKMKNVVKDAISLGLKEICFTDHVDYEKYYIEYLQLVAEYKNKINLKMGLEFGMQRHTIDDFEKLFKRYPFDCILLSVHQINDVEFWTGEYQKGKTQEEYNLEYYEELLYLVKHYHNYSVLAHLDLITRYDSAGIISFELIKPVITEILKTVIADGKGIEFNTSWHRYGLQDTTPSREILKLYKELGFTHFCTYDKMKTIFHRLEEI